MPYIEPSLRRKLDPFQSLLNDGPPAVSMTAGELNYQITRLVQAYILGQGALQYENLNAAIGALESAKLELYRRWVAPYEDTKIAQNGDVY